jgi:hypothetical protein
MKRRAAQTCTKWPRNDRLSYEPVPQHYRYRRQASFWGVVVADAIVIRGRMRVAVPLT